MLQPKRTKFRKAHKGRIHGMAKGGVSLNFGSYGLKATRPERVTARQIESARRAITRHLIRTGGTPEFWVCRVKPGKIMFELDGVTEESAKEAFSLAAAKLPLETKFVRKII